MEFKIADRIISPEHPPLVIAEIGINHDGDITKAFQMIEDAKRVGCECVKFQCHIIDDLYGEMIPNKVIPANAKESIYTMMQRCSFTEEQELELKYRTEALGMIYLSTPFSRAAVDRLEKLGVHAYKIGSGECNNYPLIEYIAKKGKPVILSTGMNDHMSITMAVTILQKYNIPYAIMQCTSMYPTPYNKVNLGALRELEFDFAYETPSDKDEFVDLEFPVVGLSDHSIGNYTSFAAVALGASIIEKHFTSDKNWSGSDVPISIDPKELKDLIIGCNAIWEARGGKKQILEEETPTIKFAYASVVSITDIKKGDKLTEENIWVKRPAPKTQDNIGAFYFDECIGAIANRDIKKDTQLEFNWID